MIEEDKRDIYIMDICVADQGDVVEGLGVTPVAQLRGVQSTGTPTPKKNNFLIQPTKIIAEIADILKDKLEKKN